MPNSSQVLARPHIPRAETSLQDARAAVIDFKAQIGDSDLDSVLFFCSAEYDLAELADEMNSAFSCPVFGCTTAGEIGLRYQTKSLIGVGFPKRHFKIHAKLIESLKDFDFEACFQLKRSILEEMGSDTIDLDRSLGLVLIDGLSVQEERLVANLYNCFEGLKIVGGSAGDNLKFEEALVYADGRFVSEAALFAFIETDLPFKTFKFQHLEPTEKDLIITSADPLNRVVHEIDGGVAAEEYANILGIDLKELDAQIFSRYPLMIQIGNEWYVRSIQKMNEDGSLTFFCAIDEGLPMTVSRGADFVETLHKQVDSLREEISDIVLTIGCDCILRKLEIQQKGISAKVENILRLINFFGFSTFGEQYNALHINQTLTGVVFGSG